MVGDETKPAAWVRCWVAGGWVRVPSKAAPPPCTLWCWLVYPWPSLALLPPGCEWAGRKALFLDRGDETPGSCGLQVTWPDSQLDFSKAFVGAPEVGIRVIDHPTWKGRRYLYRGPHPSSNWALCGEVGDRYKECHRVPCMPDTRSWPTWWVLTAWQVAIQLLDPGTWHLCPRCMVPRVSLWEPGWGPGGTCLS